jgi:NAD(P)-dependent dehydrogenase (short-subunit alcohol dehydrogenase family)
LHLVGGWTGGKSIAEFTAQDAGDMVGQHLWTTWNLLHSFAPLLASNHWGRVIVVSSSAVARPPAKSAPYVAAKAAQEALVLTLAQELKEDGVTANIIQVRAISGPDTPPKNSTPPEEIAAAMLYLCSDEARNVNGARIPLFGNS